MGSLGNGGRSGSTGMLLASLRKGASRDNALQGVAFLSRQQLRCDWRSLLLSTTTISMRRTRVYVISSGKCPQRPACCCRMMSHSAHTMANLPNERVQPTSEIYLPRPPLSLRITYMYPWFSDYIETICVPSETMEMICVFLDLNLKIK
jgi:hypothetical protein